MCYTQGLSEASYSVNAVNMTLLKPSELGKVKNE